MTCRICRAETRPIMSFGAMPPANRLKSTPDESENEYPLDLEFCPKCRNVQLAYCVPAAELYDTYFYATPLSPSLDAHYRNLIAYLQDQRLISPDTGAVEIGSNIGHFAHTLQPHIDWVLGVDPARNIVELARQAGVDTLCDYFSARVARDIVDQRGPVDLVVARHCAAHNEDPHALLDGVDTVLSPQGAFVMENAYGLTTLLQKEIGQVYHEHMFYFTIQAVDELFRRHNLELVDLIPADVHSGTMVFVAMRPGVRAQSQRMQELLATERRLLNDKLLNDFERETEALRDRIWQIIERAREKGHSITLYGASAKASTFVNYMGITSEHIPACADSTPIKLGRYLPKANIRVIDEHEAITAMPDVFLVTAWNYADEIVAKVRAQGNQHSTFVIPYPTLREVH